jgi:hypothetical protein
MRRVPEKELHGTIKLLLRVRCHHRVMDGHLDYIIPGRGGERYQKGNSHSTTGHDAHSGFSHDPPY